MAKSIRDTSKKRETRGRKKTTGPGEAVMVRLHPPLLTNLDDWAKDQSDKPSRPEAIRRILIHALTTKRRVEPLAKKAAAHAASDLADREVERVSDKSVPREEHERRKRKLIHGPREFREFRSDQPKTKGKHD